MPNDPTQSNMVLGTSMPFLKATISSVVQRVGYESAAVVLGKNKGRIHEFCSLGHEAGPSPWQVVELERFVGSPSITAAMAAMQGFTLVPSSQSSTPITPDILGQAALESGEAVSAIAHLLQGITGKATQGHKADALREIDEALAVLQSVRRGIMEAL